MNKLFGRVSVRLLLSLFSICLTVGLNGQDLDDVVISGKVTDANGAIVVGAKVTATFVFTGVKRSVKSDENGRYRLIELQPGVYSIKVVADGFATNTKTGLMANSGQGVQINFELYPAGVIANQTVSIADLDVPLIDTTRTIVGSTVSGREIQELPNTSNDVLDLVYATGGTAEESFSIRNLANDDRIGGGNERDQPSEVLGAGSISLAGGAAYSTNITIDGLDNNDDRAAEQRFQPPIDSIAEIQIIQSQFSAEYGRASGGRINIRTKAGSRSLRGGASLFFEDDGLNANTYNNNRRGLGRLPFTEWEPGLTLVGPVPIGYFKQKTYFSSAYSFRDRTAATQIFSALPVEQNPLFPLPQPTDPSDSRIDDDPGKSGTFPAVDIAAYSVRVQTPSRRHRFTQRIDHNFADRHNITFSYQLGRSESFRQYRETTRFLEDTLQGRTRKNDSFYVTDNYVFNSNTVNQFRFQFSSFRPDFSTAGTQDPVVLMFVSDDSRSGSPDQVRGTVVIGNSTSNFASLRTETRYQIQETLNYVSGEMNWRFGVDAQRVVSENVDLKDSTGTFNFWRVADFLSNQPSRYRRNFGASSKQRNTYLGLFVQNDWRITSNMSLALGLRYERESLVSDGNNLGPRVALAYAPGISGNSVFRVGAGVFYNRTLLRTLDDYTLGVTTRRFDSESISGPSNESRCLYGPTVSDAATEKCRFLQELSAWWPTAPTEEDLSDILSSLGITNGGFTTNTNFSRLIEDGIKIPESYQFNVGYEREIGRGFAFETNFTWNKATRLWRETNINSFRAPRGYSTLTDYLVSLGITSVGGTMTSFEVGDPSDSVGTRVENGVRIVNLATLNSSTAGSAPIGIAFAALEADGGIMRPYDTSLEQVEQVNSIGSSIYEGLSFDIRRRFGPLGFGFLSSMRFNYTLSRNRDDGFVDTSSAQISGDFKREFGRSSIDRRHKIRYSGTIEFPKWLGAIKFSPLLRVESGRPFNVSIGGRDRNLDDVSNDRPNYNGDLSDIVWRHPDDPFPHALASKFTLAPIGTPGDLPRNAGTGPMMFMFDLNIGRQFQFGDRIRLRPQISLNNILNATVYSFGSDFIDLSDVGTDEFEQGFFIPSRTLRQRKIQLGVRFDF